MSIAKSNCDSKIVVEFTALPAAKKKIDNKEERFIEFGLKTSSSCYELNGKNRNSIRHPQPVSYFGHVIYQLLTDFGAVPVKITFGKNEMILIYFGLDGQISLKKIGNQLLSLHWRKENESKPISCICHEQELVEIIIFHFGMSFEDLCHCQLFLTNLNKKCPTIICQNSKSFKQMNCTTINQQHQFTIYIVPEKNWIYVDCNNNRFLFLSDEAIFSFLLNMS